MGKQKGRSLKKNRAAVLAEASEVVNAPHSFVLHRGLPCPYIVDLTHDYRRMMEPFTASALRERKSNKIKDFVALSGVFHVSHMCIFNKTKNQLSYKIARLQRGPTLTFKVHQFTLSKDVVASVRKQFVDEEGFKHAPLIILNNFTGEGKHLKLMATTFQNMYPTINLATVQLSTIKRCALISYNPITELIDVRHYAVTVAPVGLSRNVKKVVMGKIPNLGRCEDIADFLASGNLTDSEFEDDEEGQVVLPQTLKSRGNIENNKSAVKLHEIGPRLTLELSKIEEGLFNGEVLYHRKVVKTEEELALIKLEREKKKKEKARRRKIQEENTQNKDLVKDEHKRKSMAGMKVRFDRNEVDTPDDDDAAYYKEEIGEEPDEELYTAGHSSGRKRGFTPKFMANNKRRKTDDSKSSGDRFKKDKYEDKRFGGGFKKDKYGDKKFSGDKSKFDSDDRKPKFSGRRDRDADSGRGGGKGKFDGSKSKFGGGKSKFGDSKSKFDGGKSKFGSKNKASSSKGKGKKRTSRK